MTSLKQLSKSQSISKYKAFNLYKDLKIRYKQTIRLYERINTMGASSTGIEALSKIKQDGDTVISFLDSNEELIGKKVEGIQVQDPESVKKYNKDIMVVVCSANLRICQKLIQQLREWGMTNAVRFSPEKTSPAQLIKPITPIVISTMPKTGTAYINKILEDSFGSACNFVDLQGGRWPHSTLNRTSLNRMNEEGNLISAGLHLMPFKMNAWDFIEHGINKIVVHYRDPRQALLSWLHHIEKLNNENRLPSFSIPTNPDYFNFSLEQKIDYLINSPHFEGNIEYLRGWKEIKEKFDGKLAIHFSSFIEMKNNPESFFEEIFRFFEVDKNQFPLNLSDAIEGKRHFRKGLIDEWKQVFTEKQIKKTDDMISQEIKDYFKL